MVKNLVKVQTELKAPKGQYNSFGKYRYRSCEDILEAVKPLLDKYELELTVSDTIDAVSEDVIVENGKETHIARVYVKATATIEDTDGNTKSVTASAREPMDKKGMDSSQITGTASSYARKYALNGLFLIDDTKDADTDEYQKTTKAKTTTTKAKTTTKEVTVAEKNKFIKDCRALNYDPELVLKQTGWESGKMTKDQLSKAEVILDEIKEAVEANRK